MTGKKSGKHRSPVNKNPGREETLPLSQEKGRKTDKGWEPCGNG